MQDIVHACNEREVGRSGKQTLSKVAEAQMFFLPVDLSKAKFFFSVGYQ